MSGFLTTGAVGDLLNLASNLKLGPWAWGLQPASWRGVHFAVRSSVIRRGRRVVVHEYPFRDDVWVEDLGRGTRLVSFSGFLLGDDVFAQRDRMAAAAEEPGSGALVHPSLGTLQASLVEFSAGERLDLGRVVELEFSFIQSPPKAVFPTSALSTGLQVGIAALQAGLATAQDYISAVTGAIAGIHAGLTFASNLFATVKGIVIGFISLATAASLGSGAAANAVRGLPGNYGRYGSGPAQPATATVSSILAAVCVAREAVTGSGLVVDAVVDPALLPAAARGLTETVRAVAPDPADQIRILSDMAAYAPSPGPSTAPVGMAIAAMQAATASLFRAAALISIANATASYQPSSYDDAVAILLAVTALFDAEILAAADAGATPSYLALRSLRAAVTADLLARAANLPHLRTVTNRLALPSLTLAYSLYVDATRSDELIARGNPISPLFMPLSFVALSQ